MLRPYRVARSDRFARRARAADPGRLRRRRDQGRAAGRQPRRAARPPLDTRLPPAAAEPALPRLQPRQAQRRARSRQRRGPRPHSAASSPAAISSSRTPAPGAMAARRLGFDALREINPRLVYVAVTPFGQDGPYAQPPRHRPDAGGDGRHDGVERRRRPAAGAHHACRRPGTTPRRRAPSPRWSPTARRLTTGDGAVRRRLGPGGRLLDRPQRDDRPRHPGQRHRAQRHPAAAQHAGRPRSSIPAPTARSC